MATRLTGRFLSLDVPYEPLDPGPMGRHVIVVDYDPVRNCWYEPIDLEDGRILAQDGLQPSEGDPRSHQQIVYAVTSSVIEQVERFMGRRFRWRGSARLKLVPHAFEGRNAYFDPKVGVLFGYYEADLDDPGANLPGQVVYTCLSNDIVAHEVTHALIHRLRRRYSEPSNRDVLAIHEGIADLVALFHHFVHREIVHDAIASSSAEIETGTGLFDLAQQFGQSTGRGKALRTGLSTGQDQAEGADGLRTPDSVALYRDSRDPHQRAANLVIAVFDAYLDVYRAAIADLLRIATGGTGVLPPGRLHPDLVARVTDEAVRSAQRMLGMVIRAFDYMPVVDPTFGDLVRAIVTADHELYPDDSERLRARLVEALRRRGIYPKVASLADDSLVWPAPAVPLSFGGRSPTAHLVDTLLGSSTADLDLDSDPGSVVADAGAMAAAPALPGNDLGTSVYEAFSSWAHDHAVELGLHPDPAHPIVVEGLHVSYRQASDRQPRPEIVLQFSQRRTDLETPGPGRPAFPVRAGTTVVARASGEVHYLVAKPLPTTRPLPDAAGQDAGAQRLFGLERWIADVERYDPAAAYLEGPAIGRLTFAALHLDGG